MELKELETELKIIGQFIANILIAQIVAKGKVASGNLRDSVGFTITRTPNSYQIDLLADNYITFVDGGRKAGFPSSGNGEFLRNLITWVKVKGLESDDKAARQAAWAIRNAIFKRGIPPTNIIDFAIEEIERNIDEMVIAALDKDIKSIFDKIIVQV